LPESHAPLRRLTVFALAVVFVVGALGVAAHPGLAGSTSDRDEQLRFMWAMAGQESGWDYNARNSASGAFGKYQIMPFNWPAWAGKYLGDRHADQTPYNQEKVAYGKLADLHDWLGTWKRVAYWWLTGSSEKNEKKWSSYAKGYVRNIMQLRKQAPAGGWKMPAKTSSRPKPGDWRRSGEPQALRLKAGGAPWPDRGRLKDGQVLRVRQVKTSKAGLRWIRVVTVDGRLGWLKQQRTVPANKPKTPKRWGDVKDEGTPVNRRQARPRPQ
jgi:hypothetical protein